MRSGWPCKSAARLLGIPPNNFTRAVAPHFTTLVKLMQARPQRTIATFTIAMCRAAGRESPGEARELAWRLTNEYDLRELADALALPRGTVQQTVRNCFEKIARLMAADPLLTWIDLAVAANGLFLDALEPMPPVELARRDMMATGRLPRRVLHGQRVEATRKQEGGQMTGSI